MIRNSIFYFIAPIAKNYTILEKEDFSTKATNITRLGGNPIGKADKERFDILKKLKAQSFLGKFFYQNACLVFKSGR